MGFLDGKAQSLRGVSLDLSGFTTFQRCVLQTRDRYNGEALFRIPTSRECREIPKRRERWLP